MRATQPDLYAKVANDIYKSSPYFRDQLLKVCMKRVRRRAFLAAIGLSLMSVWATHLIGAL